MDSELSEENDDSLERNVTLKIRTTRFNPAQAQLQPLCHQQKVLSG